MFAIELLRPVRHWIDGIEIHDRKRAFQVCKLIPAQCPLERDIKLFGYRFHIPPLCKLNPVYEELVGLRFRALCYLAGEPRQEATNKKGASIYTGVSAI